VNRQSLVGNERGRQVDRERQDGVAGKMAFITGSARGLGKMTALKLAGMGIHVAVNYVHSQDEAEALVQSLRELGVRSTAIQGDITDPEQPKRLIAEAERQLGSGIDILVNNAGPFLRERRRFADYTEAEIESLIQGNFLSVMRFNRLVIPGMRERGWGRIIHFGFGRSGEARGWPDRAVYAAAKVGLVSFTKTLAVEEAPFGITVNMICPGDIRGDYKERLIQEVEGLIDEESPRGRPGTGEDVARVIAFLCESPSDYVTGNIIDVSGGLDPIRNHVPVRAKT
jgi:3-oxoacyl-[acyl-carrier protein] reductase